MASFFNSMTEIEIIIISSVIFDFFFGGFRVVTEIFDDDSKSNENQENQ